jgi:dolichol-phosphate mannosyltransferase
MALSNRQLATATISLLVFRLTTAFLVELTPQEAYYWNYTIHPALSYFDHPPVVAWVIRAGYLVLGKSELGIRIGGFVLTLLSTWLLFVLGKLWFNKKAGLWAALLFQLVPLSCLRCAGHAGRAVDFLLAADGLLGIPCGA